MMKRLLQTIFGIVLAISVFLSQSQVVRAADALGKFDGSYTFVPINQTIGASGVENIFVDGSVVNSIKIFSSDFVLGYLVLEFDAGHSYTGTMSFTVPVSLTPVKTTPINTQYLSLVGNTSTGPSYSVFGSGTYSYTVGVTSVGYHVYVNFNNYSVSTTSNVRIPVVCSLTAVVDSEYLGVPLFFTAVPSRPASYVNDLYDAVQVADGSTVQFYVNEQTTIIKNNHDEQMQQQQEIAAAQASQSAQQHEQAINGYDNTANNAMLQDKGNQLAAYEASQGAAFDTGQKYVTDFSTNYSTSAFHNLSPSFILLSGWFNRLWSGLGNFTSILAVALVLCVAGYILKIKH